MSETKTMAEKLVKSESEWRKELTPMQYAVLREKATERLGTQLAGSLLAPDHERGTQQGAGCGAHAMPN